MAKGKRSSKNAERKLTPVTRVRGVDGNRRSPKLDRNYLHALKSHWEGRARTTIERVAQSIVEAEDATSCLPFYRLWIESLAAGNEKAALSHLSDHLLFLGSTDPDDAPSFMALRGIVHFELDEFEAASSICRFLRKDSVNPYAAELKYLVESRAAPRFKKSPFEGLEHDLRDYFHFESLAKSYVLRHHEPEYHHLARHIREHFAESPLLDIIDMVSLSAKGDYLGALVRCEAIMGRFPGNLEYSIQYGVVAIRAQQFDKAVSELYRALSLHQEPDADLHSLLGQALAERAMVHGDQHGSAKAKEQLEKAIALYQDLGVPITTPKIYLDTLDARFGNQSTVEGRQGNSWIVRLSQRRFYSLKEAHIDQIRKLRRPLGGQVQRGDICFFVCDDQSLSSREDKQWRLGAVYEVTSDPIWHPKDKYQSRLTLIARPEVSIPIPIHEVRGILPGNEVDNQGDGNRFAVYALNGHALRDMEAAINEFSSEFTELKRALS